MKYLTVAEPPTDVQYSAPELFLPFLPAAIPPQGAHMTTLGRNARIAGLLYLTLSTAPLRLIYIPNHLIVSGNAAAAAWMFS
jgi:hypothetical protein